MRYLLDTHVWLWMLAAPERIRKDIWPTLLDRDQELLLSAASSWEIAIKYRLRRLELPAPPEEFVPHYLRESGVAGFPIQHRHALRVAALPDHHRDPFDRLLVAQAQMEELTIITADPLISRYPAKVLPAV